ncbi:MAG: peptide chain release factor 2 [Pseudomonadota bacterium]|nr:peptide chain release factor 2 [Pseudomonadota bacterium]MEC7465162.1 peptide chain release factor 2 [Pseudomonadota bacterium]MEC7786908.1 peptide chain release factor 2 [Pseudomonadota bacterium]MEC8107995.1 peptide chain release factor 2 [Pseudomonadota bacterium]MEC8377717.1 peptide chain release factor 2 [Pseudomonadota bacterium]
MTDRSLQERLKESKAELNDLRGFLDYESKQKRLESIKKEFENPELWKNQEKSQSLGKEKSSLEKLISSLDELESSLNDLDELLILLEKEDDKDEIQSLSNELSNVELKISDLQFQRMFSGKNDSNNAFLDIQAGSGGTEAQDWAEMLLRMYLMWGEKKNFKTELIEVSPGEVAGIKSATIRFEGEFSYGWLRTESGVHRLVRKSPFDSGSRRHTSFASIFISPEIEDNIEINIDPSDIRIDTYRASGAGGQHVNKTDSAVRLTHEPTGVVVQCQSDRSQHKNKDRAMKQLRAKLYELELKKQDEAMKNLEETKADISWGSQIRSYVLDSGRIKDLRTGTETGNCSAVLDGNIDIFIEESLKAGV